LLEVLAILFEFDSFFSVVFNFSAAGGFSPVVDSLLDVELPSFPALSVFSFSATLLEN